MKGKVAGREGGVVDLFVAALNPTRQVKGHQEKQNAVQQVEIGDNHSDNFWIKLVAGRGRAQAALLMSAAHGRG